MSPRHLSVRKEWSPHKYMPSIDGIRAVAVLMVFLSHAYPAKFPGGGAGVDLFLAVSGFLITGLAIEEYQRNGKIDILRFYGRRALRLLPALYLMLFITYWFIKPTFLEILSIILYFANWLRVTGDNLGFYGHTWSLAVEEQFYFGWPLVLVTSFYVARKFKCSLKMAVAIAAIFGIAIAAAVLIHGGTYERLYNSTDVRVLGLLLGGIAASIMHKIVGTILERIIQIAFLPLSVILLVYVFTGSFISQGEDRIILSICSTVIVMGAALDPLAFMKWFLENKATLYIGKISYGFYLWHYPLVGLFIHVIPKYRILIVFVLTMVVASLSWYLIERPISRKLRKYVSVK